MVFYVLEITYSATSKFSSIKSVGDVSFTDPPKCVDCGEALGLLVEIPPHRYRLKGRNAGDLLTDGLVCAISLPFKDAYDKSTLRGLNFSDDPIELTNSDLTYYMAQPVHTRTLIDEEASGAVVDIDDGCEKCRVTAKVKLDNITIKEESWGGEDIFYLGSLMGLILVTERFVNFVKEHEFTNFVFIHQKDYHEDYT